MPAPQPDLDLLAIFVAVAEQGSFSRAAARLAIGKATVSRGVARLEAQLGAELVHRNTHHVSLSTAGAALFERARPAIEALRRSVQDLPERDDSPSGLLRMTAPHDFGTITLPPVLAAFGRRYPAVRFDLRLSTHRVDLVREGFDLAIRAVMGPLQDSSLTLRRLTRTGAGFYASPSYVARRGRPRRVGDERHVWVVHPGPIGRLPIPAEAVQFVVDDFLLARALVLDGAAVGLLPTFVALGSVREGLLEEIPLEGLPESQGEVVLLYPSSGVPAKKVTAFRDFLVDSLAVGLR